MIGFSKLFLFLCTFEANHFFSHLFKLQLFFFINIYVHNKENIEIIIEEHGSSLPLKANPIIRPYFQCTEIIKYC